MNTEHVYRKFPYHIEAIQALLEKDATFREIFTDYAKICTWLVDYCRLQDRPSEDCDHARQLMRELEDEITESLRSTAFKFSGFPKPTSIKPSLRVFAHFL